MVISDVQLFISSLIPSLDESPVQFNGETRFLKRAIDENMAYSWHLATKAFVQYELISINVFGTTVKKAVAFVSDEALEKENIKCESVLKEVNDMIRVYPK